MAEVWAAAIGAAAAVGGTAYSIISSNNAINAANSVKPPKFVPINADQVNQMAQAADRAAYGASDADWEKRFPILAKGRTASIDMASRALQGGQDPQVLQALKESGINANLGDSEFQQARSLGLPILSLEQRDRAYFQRLLADNPQRQIGLSGGDIAHIAIANTNSQNNYNQGLFGSRINQYNSQIAQNAQNIGAATSAAIGTVNIGAQLYQNNQLSSYLNSDSYRSTFGPPAWNQPQYGVTFPTLSVPSGAPPPPPGP